MDNTLSISIVGHTNTGKTSLLRTLLRNSRFGEVQDQAGTTRHVESIAVAIDGAGELELKDTPGLEDSSALLTQLESLREQGLGGRECLLEFCKRSAQFPEFEQEIKVLRQALDSDLLMYVIDAREPVLSKYLHEVQCLLLAARPILPVLNFIHFEPNHLRDWHAQLAELGLHAYVAFDTVAFDFDAEVRLYQKMQTLMESHYEQLQKLTDQRRRDWQNLQHTTSNRIAHLLFDTARITLTGEAVKPLTQKLQQQVRELEHACLEDLLELLRFGPQDIQMAQLPVADGQWQMDLFSAETLKNLGLDTASAAATGAAIGLGVDLLLAGMSLGAASATGALLGAAWHNSRRFGKNLLQKFKGHAVIQVNDTTLDALLVRQLWLCKVLFERGHAAVTPAAMASQPPFALPQSWVDERKRLRAAANGWGKSETDALKSLTGWLQQQLNP